MLIMNQDDFMKAVGEGNDDEIRRRPPVKLDPQNVNRNVLGGRS